MAGGNRVQKAFFDKAGKKSNRTARTNHTKQTAASYKKQSTARPQPKVKLDKNATALERAVAEPKAEERPLQLFRDYGWQPYFDDKTPRSQQTPAQKHTRDIAKIWTNLPHFLLHEDYWPRDAKTIRGRDGATKVIGSLIEDSDEWPLDCLKLLCKWATRCRGMAERPGEEAKVAKESIDGIETWIDMRRGLASVSEKDPDYGLTLDDIQTAFELWCREKEKIKKT